MGQTRMKILFAQPIFAPDENQLIRNLASLKTLFDYLGQSSLYEIDFVFGGWCKEEHFWKHYFDLINARYGDVMIINFNKNLGKATVVNQLISMYNKYYDYIFTCDSDILFDLNEKRMFERLLNIGERLFNKNFGLISLQQKQNCAHMKSLFVNKMAIPFWDGKQWISELVMWPKYPGGIAGGALFISKKFWQYIKGYKVLGVYAGDDARIFEDAHKYQFFGAMVDSIAVIHPFDTDTEYQKWKCTVCQRDSKTGIKKDISKLVKEAEDFWSNKNNKEFV